MRKDKRIEIRVSSNLKELLKNKAREHNTTLTDYILSRINNSLTHNEINEIIKVSNENIASQKNLANNINQIARRINYNDFISREEIKVFFDQMQVYAQIQKESMKRIDKMYNLLVQRLNKIESI